MIGVHLMLSSLIESINGRLLYVKMVFPLSLRISGKFGICMIFVRVIFVILLLDQIQRSVSFSPDVHSLFSLWLRSH